MRSGSLFLLTACLILLGGCSGDGRPTGTPVPDPDTIRTIQGRILRHAMGPDLSSRDQFGRLIARPGFMESTIPGSVPRLPVEVRKLDGTVMGHGVTDNSGHYSIDVNFGQSAATQVIVRIQALIQMPFGTVVQVLPDETATQPYSHQTVPSGNPASRTMNVDLAVSLSEGAAAYYILDTLYEGFIIAREGLGASMPDLDIYWKSGNGDVSRFEADGGRGKLTIAGGITGDSTSNRDAWDAPKIARLFGEYLFGFLLNDTSPEGEPDESLLVPSAAWREGFLDFWACIARDSPEYWDTAGSGPDGRVIRYFNIESYFEPSLPPMSGSDPNVYQDPSVVGIGSAFTVAELLWDIHDPGSVGDDDNLDSFPLYLTLRKLGNAQPGISYPYLFTLFDEYAKDFSIAAGKIDALMISPEHQGLTYSPNKNIWPFHVSPDNIPFGPISIGFDKTVQDTIDTADNGSVPVNIEIGFTAQRYFLIDTVQPGNVIATLTPSADLILDIMDLNNNVIASGPSPQTGPDLPTARYIIRVRSASDPQTTTFDLRIQLVDP
ncbi:MAG: Ig-like domain-containing protein [Planctomycetota bacterium]